MSVKIASVLKDSPAHRAGIVAGETLVSINGHEINDVLDYRFYMLEPCLELVIESGGAKRATVLKKGEYEEPGMEFDTYLMDSQKRCKNRCVFCFIDQLPKGLRDTLYFKDDDARLSFLFGNYITLTNLSDRDVERIITFRISPVNVSVHTTNPALRQKMMENPKAGESLKYLKQFADAGIMLNTQIVVCPGINDGAELKRTIDDLYALGESLQSIAVVPVGLTKYRQGLFELRPFCPDEAARVIELTDTAAKTHGCRKVYAADEFYLKAGLPIPNCDYYGDFDQLENGVGMMALFRNEFYEQMENLNRELFTKPGQSVTIATGVSAFDFIRELAEAAGNELPGIKIEVIKIQNVFFGENITVTGLLTGRDIIDQLLGRINGEKVLLSATMFRRERDLTLDGMTAADIAAQLGRPVQVVEPAGAEFLRAVAGI